MSIELCIARSECETLLEHDLYDDFVRTMKTIRDKNLKLYNDLFMNGEMLIDIVFKYDIKYGELLLAMGCNVNAKTKRGRNALFFASDVEWVDLLVSHGIDTTVEDNAGRTALHFASMIRNVNVMRKLLEMGMNPNKATEDDWTPKMYASKGIGGDKDRALELLEQYSSK